MWRFTFPYSFSTQSKYHDPFGPALRSVSAPSGMSAKARDRASCNTVWVSTNTDDSSVEGAMGVAATRRTVCSTYGRTMRSTARRAARLNRGNAPEGKGEGPDESPLAAHMPKTLMTPDQ